MKNKSRVAEAREIWGQLHQARVAEARELWDKLGDIPVNDDGEIEEPFRDFGIGADQKNIWHWFEEYFDISVGDDLLYGRPSIAYTATWTSRRGFV